MEIKVLGPGCPKCKQTEQNVKDVVAETGIDATVEKVTDIMEIAGYGFFGTPSVALDKHYSPAIQGLTRVYETKKEYEFAAKILSKISVITLFSVIPNVDLLCELDPPFIQGFVSEKYPDYCQTIQDEKRRLLENTLQAGRQVLLEAGFKAESMSPR